MRFEQPLIEGTLLRRNRFVADVKLPSGDEISAHCAHAGSMLGCSDPGSKVLLSEHNDSRRKLKHQIEIIFAGRTPVGIHTGRPTAVVAEAIMAGKIKELAGYAVLRRETAIVYGTHVDITLEGNSLRSCYIQVKNVTLAENKVAYFPDTISPIEGQRLTELTDLIRKGHRGMAIFVAQRCDVEAFRLADHIDPDYGQTFRDAVARGVEILCFRANVTRKGIDFDEQLPVEINL
ncbi:MAG: DNA/RNA nuclease SfsA [Deltaproteobacteria bacterium]|nr:DNA/RNA nuclease SfsA [Deltaproteobacteria bacterium]